MFNLWKRTYVHQMSQRNIFETKAVIADKEWAGVIFPSTMFAGGELVHQEQTIDAVITKYYDGQVANFFNALIGDSEAKWSIVVSHDDYYKLLAYFLKELQHTYQFTDAELHMIAYSYLYNNFYYSGDQSFVDGFIGQAHLDIIKEVFATYEPTGILAPLDPVDLPTEIGYFLANRDYVEEAKLAANFDTVAKLVVNRLWQVHFNDFSEWLILDTPHFLNMLKSDATPTVLTDEFSFHDMLNFMKADPYLNAMFFSTVTYTGGSTDWDTNPDYKITASRVVAAWQKLADYLVARGIDADWAELRHSQYAEIILRYEYVSNTCKAIQFILGLDGAPETLDQPIIEMLGYDVLSECMNSKYNKTLLLLTLRGMSKTFENFITTAFEEQDNG